MACRKMDFRFALAVIICIIFTAPMVMADEGMNMGNEQYVYTEYPLERNGISLHLDRMVLEGAVAEKNILLLHGSSNASHESYPPFSHNTWEQAAEDFQRREDGTFDLSVTDPVIIELFCSSCWHYDGEYSPNGWRKDACVDKSQVLIDLDAIRVPTLLICGGKDPYMNYEIIDGAMEHLPEGSAVEVIPGGSHIVMLEKPYYRDFQERVAGFLQ